MRSAFKSFTDPGEFAAMLRPAKVEVIPLACGRFVAKFAHIQLPRIRLRHMSESLPRLAHVQHPPDRAYFGFLATETSAPVMVDGMNVTADRVLRFGPLLHSNQHSIGATQWANISFDRAELSYMDRSMADQDLAACGAFGLMTPDRNAMDRLRRLHAQTVTLATGSSVALDETEVVRALENQLLEALMDCLGGSEQRRPTLVQTRHAMVVERFRELLDRNLDRSLYLPEVCEALGVSRRTLSYCCQEFLGMAPKRYFFLRRIYMVRRALRQAERNLTTVTEIATRYGFWEFGRFSVQYKALFGETPSATLRRESRESGNAGL